MLPFSFNPLRHTPVYPDALPVSQLKHSRLHEEEVGTFGERGDIAEEHHALTAANNLPQAKQVATLVLFKHNAVVETDKANSH